MSIMALVAAVSVFRETIDGTAESIDRHIERVAEMKQGLTSAWESAEAAVHRYHAAVALATDSVLTIAKTIESSN